MVRSMASGSVDSMTAANAWSGTRAPVLSPTPADPMAARGCRIVWIRPFSPSNRTVATVAAGLGLAIAIIVEKNAFAAPSAR